MMNISIDILGEHCGYQIVKDSITDAETFLGCCGGPREIGRQDVEFAKLQMHR